MEILPSFEVRAGRIPGSVERLQFLRRTAQRQPSSFPWKAGLGGAIALVWVTLSSHAQFAPPQHRSTPKIQPAAQAVEKVWVVEERPAYTAYSNGLHVRTDYLTNSKPRSYHTFARLTLAPSGEQHTPAGIVFHTTESLLLPLEAGRNSSLVRTREYLLQHIQHERCYNFVVDRFGQVFRVVPEAEVAFHAGYSIWADGDDVFLNLNDSFLGVAFEQRTDQSDPSNAQLRSARMLTEMLRSVYNIPASRCATHAQVSVNPDNMRIGFHTDWAARFPFHELGLPNGYDHPVGAIERFGFQYDDHFLNAIGGHPWDGVLQAEDHLLRDAANHGMTAATYRQRLQQQYKALRRDLHENAETAPTSTRT